MSKSTDDVIKSLQESPDGEDGVGRLSTLQIQGILKHLLASHQEKDLEIQNLKKQVKELKGIGKPDGVGHQLNNGGFEKRPKVPKLEEVVTMDTRISSSQGALDTFFRTRWKPI